MHNQNFAHGPIGGGKSWAMEQEIAKAEAEGRKVIRTESAVYIWTPDDPETEEVVQPSPMGLRHRRPALAWRKRQRIVSLQQHLLASSLYMI